LSSLAEYGDYFIISQICAWEYFPAALQ